MPHEVHASIQITLPDDPKEMVAMLSGIAGAWSTLLAGLGTAPCKPTFSVNETKTRSKIVTARAPRKRTVPTDTSPELAV